jgi:hypothetical protein
LVRCSPDFFSASSGNTANISNNTSIHMAAPCLYA